MTATGVVRSLCETIQDEDKARRIEKQMALQQPKRRRGRPKKSDAAKASAKADLAAAIEVDVSHKQEVSFVPECLRLVGEFEIFVREQAASLRIDGFQEEDDECEDDEDTPSPSASASWRLTTFNPFFVKPKKSDFEAGVFRVVRSVASDAAPDDDAPSEDAAGRADEAFQDWLEEPMAFSVVRHEAESSVRRVGGIVEDKGSNSEEDDGSSDDNSEDDDSEEDMRTSDYTSDEDENVHYSGSDSDDGQLGLGQGFGHGPVVIDYVTWQNRHQ